MMCFLCQTNKAPFDSKNSQDVAGADGIPAALRAGNVVMKVARMPGSTLVVSTQQPSTATAMANHGSTKGLLDIT